MLDREDGNVKTEIILVMTTLPLFSPDRLDFTDLTDLYRGDTGIPSIKLTTRRAVLSLLALMICGCTSSVAVGTAYNTAASRFTTTLTDYADFTSGQEKIIDRRVSAFHQWHRENQLRQYLVVMQQLSGMLSKSDAVKPGDVHHLTKTVQELIEQLSKCSPLNSSGAFLQTLSDRQVKQISTKIRDKHAQRVREYESETADERLKKRQKNLAKWSKRAGVTMSDEQQTLLEATLQKQISLSPQRQALWQAWSEQLINQLNNRHSDGFVMQADKHIDSLWRLTANAYPEEWQNNIVLWQEFLFRFIQLMTDEQIKRFTSTIDRLSVTIEKLSNKPGKTKAECFAAAPQ